jgi:predicted nucleic acid-binding Zn ribbon protein
MPKRLCVICGARVRNQNPKTTTCSPFCTQVLKTGKTRDQLIAEDCKIDDGDITDINYKVKLLDQYQP